MTDNAETSQQGGQESGSSKVATSLAAAGVAAAQRAKEKRGSVDSEYCAEGHNCGEPTPPDSGEKKGPMAGAMKVMNMENAELMAKLRNRKDRIDGE